MEWRKFLNNAWNNFFEKKKSEGAEFMPYLNSFAESF